MLETPNLEYKIFGAAEPAMSAEVPPRAADGIERKDMTPSPDAEMRTTLEQLMYAFEDFKASNDERFDAIEKRAGADVLTEEKTARSNARLDQQQRIVAKLAAQSRSGHAGTLLYHRELASRRRPPPIQNPCATQQCDVDQT